MTPAPPVARLAAVTHRYGARVALGAVDLSIPAGKMVGLIGPDGVGKSTLLALVAGVRRVQSGKVTALGGSMRAAAHRQAVCARIAYMPQGLGRNLYPTLSVVENVDFFARLFGQGAAERAARIADLLRGTGLSDFADRPAGKLSGGMKQKLGLCCALVHDPDLLILDEPTTGVDPLSRRQFWDLIARIRARRPGMSVLTATAYMSEAEGFEWLVAMDAGAVLAEGTPADLRGPAASLEDAFVALLPETARRGHVPVVVPPRIAADGPPAIEARGLTMRFGDFTAVDDVSFRIDRGEIFGFLGSNGCGKTTTMKMLTGLLTPSAGEARLFGAPLAADSLAARRRVGYMSQGFSLYGELTVRQNLKLHADLFSVPQAQRGPRVAALLARFDLQAAADAAPEALALGVRQRLQLAVAVLHAPEILILDEPTSGVDPVARDNFWTLLIELSRRDGVTIFITTHFMNEAGRCDRIALMHAGRVLATGAPEALRQDCGAATLEDAFVHHLTEAGAGAGDAVPDTGVPVAAAPAARRGVAGGYSLGRLWAFARREAIEIRRDPIRLGFALVGPVVLMLTIGFGITFDVENLTYAVLDQDRSRESRMASAAFAGSRYFAEMPPIADLAALDRRMARGEMSVALVYPPGFGRDLLAGRTPQIGVWLDGSNTTRAETGRGYVQGVLAGHLADVALQETGAPPAADPATIAPRFRYNQGFESRQAIPPGVLMLLLIMIPAMLTALGVVREKEIGSIVKLYAAPARRIEFLVGKQAPYVAVGMASCAILVGLMLSVFGLPWPRDPVALGLGALLCVTAATGFGLVVSTFVRSQIAAIFATSIIVMVPTINFSGMLYPVSTLTGAAALIGQGFPALYFQRISAGVFNKDLGLAALWPDLLALALFCALYWTAASLLLGKQAR